MAKDTVTIHKKALSHLSHELKNPLAATKLYLEMLLMGVAGPITDKQREVLLELTHSNDKMTVLLDSFKKEFLS
jgi:signal transduction histidine kinase